MGVLEELRGLYSLLKGGMSDSMQDTLHQEQHEEGIGRSPSAAISVSISRDNVVDSWCRLIENGAGKAAWVMETTERFIKEFHAPNVLCQRAEVSTGYFGITREFLAVTHWRLRDYGLYISARDYGRDLDVSWFLTLSPGFVKRKISKYATGNPHALSMTMNIFDHQDLSAYTSMAHHCLQRALKLLMDELNQDYSTVNTKSKGFLELW